MKEKGQQSVELMILLSVLLVAFIIVTMLVFYYNDTKAELDRYWHLNNECTKLSNQFTMVNSYGRGMTSQFSTLDYNTTVYDDETVIQLVSGDYSVFCVYPEMVLVNDSDNSTFEIPELSSIEIDNNGTEVVVTVV